MLRNYLTVAFRTLRNQPVYTGINTLGLSVGMAACLLIALYVGHEWSFDRFHQDADRIARIVETRTTPDGAERVAGTAGPVAPTAVQEVPGVAAATRIAQLFRVTVERGDTRFYVGDYLIAEPSFFDVFDFPLAQGDPQAVLREPGTVVLTHATAQRYFGDENPIGQTMSIEGYGEATVTAVLAPLPAASHLQFSMLLPFETVAQQVPWWTRLTEDWASGFRSFATYAKLEDGATHTAMAEQVATLMARNTPADAMPSAVTLQPLTDIHLHSVGIQGGFNAQPGNATYVLILGLLALFILGLACINYMNLATARAADRQREVGVRKALGAHRGQLIGRFVGEAVLLCGMALLIGALLARGALPAFNALAGTSLSLSPLMQPAVIVALVVGVVVVGALAGAYPAFVLARFRPAAVLKASQGATEGGSVWLRRGLVVTQFGVSIALIAATLVVTQQLGYIQSKELGFDEEHLVAVDINSDDVRRAKTAMKTEMRRHPAVQRVSISSRIPGDWKDIPEVEVMTPSTQPGEASSAYFMSVDADFRTTFDIALQDGRFFEPARGTDTTAVVLNETAVQAFGLTDPVGTTVRVPQENQDGTSEVLTWRVIGTVEDFHFQPLYAPIRPLVLGHQNNPVAEVDYFTARVDAGQVTAALDHLQAVSERFDPARPFEYSFVDARMAEAYQADRAVGRVVGAASGLAILIACVGLFGLAAFTAERRRKEMGIRKALGATSASIVALLSADLLKLVGIAFVVATPLAYGGMQQWLASFAYRVDLGAGLFMLAGGAALLIALLTVSTQALRAARTDPAVTLRSE
ncbi:MAG: FtsX-like permease family protein [Bacteroidetes bacterium]|jgi:putative ABC transport system permease protein|nr:FtsX-like permease family protein [Bacteroidota bacterium]